MAALQRSSKSFRRQGSSGSVWDDKSLSEEIKQLIKKEGSEDHRELRPCHSIGGMGMMMTMDSNAAAPAVYTRSLSAPAVKPAAKLFAASWKPPTILKSKSGKHKK